MRPVPVVPYTNPDNYNHQAKRYAESLENAVWGNQFDNVANRDGHYVVSILHLKTFLWFHLSPLVQKFGNKLEDRSMDGPALQELAALSVVLQNFWRKRIQSSNVMLRILQAVFCMNSISLANSKEPATVASLKALVKAESLITWKMPKLMVSAEFIEILSLQMLWSYDWCVVTICRISAH